MNHCPRVMHTGSHRSTTHRSFGAWLRHERERRNIAIASIAESTKILGALFEGLENDDLSRWPDGFYRRAFVRAYAQAIGLDPQLVVNEFVTRFPESPNESDRIAFNASVPATSGGAPEEPVLRLALADTGYRFRPDLLIRAMARRFATIGFDLGMIGLLSTALWLVVDPSFALAAVACGYHAASILIFGNTPGMWTFAGRTKKKVRRNSLLRRAHATVFGLFEQRRADDSMPVDHAMASFDAHMEAEAIR